MAPSIDPSKIVWIKSIDRPNGPLWAYCCDDPAELHPQPREPGDEFDLHWPNRLRANARGPKRDQIICLTQALHVTHLVQVMDDAPHDRPDEHCRPGSLDKRYAIARLVRALVIRRKGLAPLYDQALGFTPRLQGGPCCQIEKLKRFRESRWPSKGGLAPFQEHLVRVLGAFA